MLYSFAALDLCISENRSYQIPREVIDRDGLLVKTESDEWFYNEVKQVQRFSWSNWGLKNLILKYALKRYALLQIQIQAPYSAFNFARDIKSCFPHAPKWNELQTVQEESFQDSLFKFLGGVLDKLRNSGKIYQFSRIRSWYNWCADNIPELGFLEEYALEFNQVYVPGNLKGEAVRLEDPEEGPLWDEEVATVVEKLHKDISQERKHILQRATIALCLCYGRNPGNLVLLREEDFIDITAHQKDIPPQFILKMPRIKKRGVTARHEFVDCFVEEQTAPFIQQLVQANKDIDTGIFPRPLLMREEFDSRRIGTETEEYGFHMESNKIAIILHDFVKRMQIISPRTNESLYLTPRRLRYTFATRMVAQGISPKALAHLLDHSDTQNVQVYFDLKGRITTHLDKAAAKRIGGIIDAFKGKLVRSNDEAINGDNPARHMRYVSQKNSTKQTKIGICGQEDLCRLDPPFSCYLCPKFQPYIGSQHETVLEDLLERRGRLLAQDENRIAVQLDNIIYAVGQVVEAVGKFVLGAADEANAQSAN